MIHQRVGNSHRILNPSSTLHDKLRVAIELELLDKRRARRRVSVAERLTHSPSHFPSYLQIDHP